MCAHKSVVTLPTTRMPAGEKPQTAYCEHFRGTDSSVLSRYLSSPEFEAEAATPHAREVVMGALTLGADPRSGEYAAVGAGVTPRDVQLFIFVNLFYYPDSPCIFSDLSMHAKRALSAYFDECWFDRYNIRFRETDAYKDLKRYIKKLVEPARRAWAEAGYRHPPA